MSRCLKNPWHGENSIDDLTPEINRISLNNRKNTYRKISGQYWIWRQKLEAYGEAAVAGIDSEIEHASVNNTIH